jgi:hypothetical protein
MPLTRGRFLTQVGQAGGLGVTFAKMNAMGLAPQLARAGKSNRRPIRARALRIVILGGRICGGWKCS